MNQDRFRLALTHLAPTDWERFERLASTFFAAEFQDLRTTASPAGDGGRDAMLFFPHNDSTVSLQYSVRADWEAKIRNSARTIQNNFPSTTLLVYVTNHTIGAKADPLRTQLRTEYGLSLDVRDCNWFCERVNHAVANEDAAESLAQVVVDPLLAKGSPRTTAVPELSPREVSAAITYLGLQWTDDQRDKGLTRLTFEAIVKSALADTSPTNCISMAELRDRIYKLLPDHSTTSLDQYINSAYERLKKHHIKQFPNDTICISYETSESIRTFRERQMVQEGALKAAIEETATLLLASLKTPEGYVAEFAANLRQSIDIILFERSQAFALAAASDSLDAFADDDFADTLTKVISQSQLRTLRNVSWVDLLYQGTRDVLRGSDSRVAEYLKSLSDAYTLLAFLKVTPDVQSAVQKMFSSAELWLDASVLLPTFAELIPTEKPNDKPFTTLLEAARSAGNQLYVTAGVIEELDSHIAKCLLCAGMPTGYWQGPIPYLLRSFVNSGHSKSDFARWSENFRGDFEPRADIREYLSDRHRIAEKSLENESRDCSPELRRALQAIWSQRHQDRKGKGHTVPDDAIAQRLIENDIQCYTGVVQRRAVQGIGRYGYSAWWVTIDKKTFSLEGALRAHMTESPPRSPVMGLDFLTNYLSFGPSRSRVNQAIHTQLPMMGFLRDAAHLSPELLQEAQDLRERLVDQPNHVKCRRVRDYLIMARAHLGTVSQARLEAVGDDE